MKETIASKTKSLKTEQSRNAGLQEEKNSLTTELAASKAEVESLTQRLDAAAAAAAAVGADPPAAASEAENQENNNKLQVLQAELDAMQEERNALVVERNELRDKVRREGGRRED